MSTIPRTNALRLAKDIRNIMKNPLHDNGIYYQHDETNILIGYAMIVGPENTPYQHGFYLFKLEFTENYPHDPPKVLYFTQGDKIRFHPNLYRSGKVCVSILNTWRGEQWSSCQTISSILLTLVSLLHDKPLLNEPGITESHYDFQKYNEIITYKSMEHACLHMADEDHFNSNYNEFNIFYPTIINHIHTNINAIVEITEKLKDDNSENDNRVVTTNMYNMNARLNYKTLYKMSTNVKLQMAK
jgi:ubiquitin-protein ligase